MKLNKDIKTKKQMRELGLREIASLKGWWVGEYQTAKTETEKEKIQKIITKINQVSKEKVENGER